MLRVGNLQRSIDFYTQVLGMRLLRKSDYPGGRFTLAFALQGAPVSAQSASASAFTFSTGTPFTATMRPRSMGELLTWVTPGCFPTSSLKT